MKKKSSDTRNRKKKKKNHIYESETEILIDNTDLHSVWD